MPPLRSVATARFPWRRPGARRGRGEQAFHRNLKALITVSIFVWPAWRRARRLLERRYPGLSATFGERKKIFLIHFRNIVGDRNKFQEVWPDEGVMNMHRNMQVLKKVEYEHMVVPDHAPGHQDPENRRQGFAFDFGYIKAMIQAVMDED